jgi:UDP-GlcNAc:undecaprenyl-phosphate GlcNAc-1-phosphate transferase
MLVLNGALLACFSSLVLTPLVIGFCHRKGWFDRLDDRKIHSGAIPRLGGVAVFIAFSVAVVITAIFGFAHRGETIDLLRYVAIALGAVALFALGLYDDFSSVRARFKFFIQLAAALAVVANGFYFKVLWLPFVPHQLDLGWFGYPLTVVWIVGIVNALNMIDGLDGLAGGIGGIAAAVFGMLYIGLGQAFNGLLAFSLAGAILGYLFFNLPPARIFMGDSGAYFIGFVLAVLPLLHSGDHSRQFGLISAITVLVIPIFDVFAAIWRRLRDHTSVMQPDRSHLHHKLMDLGLSNRQILAIAYAGSMFLGATALTALYLSSTIALSIMLGVWVLFMAFFGLLHFMKHR